MSVASLSTGIAIGLTFGLFIVGAFTVFRRVEGDDIRFTAIKVVTVATLAYAVWTLYQSPPAFPAAALAACIAACALFLWAAKHVSKSLTLAYSSDEPRLLYSSGPYRFIRHPFYTSYLLGYGGVIAACGTGVSMLLGCIAVVLYTRAARFEEAKFSHSALKSSYDGYKASTGMFFPRIRKNQRSRSAP